MLNYQTLAEHLYDWGGYLLVKRKSTYNYYQLIVISTENKKTLGLLAQNDLEVIDTRVDINSEIDLKALAYILHAINIEIDCKKQLIS